jgi:PKD repeat protein
MRVKRSSRVLLAASLCAALGLLAGCFLLPNEAPVASFRATPSEGGAPLSVSFDASDSYDPDGSIRSFAWSFGDGASGNGMLVTHEFSSPGTYTVRLTVEDSREARSSSTEEIVATSGTKHAILVGIASYMPPQPSLSYTDDDAIGLRDRLLSLPGWEASNIVLLTNQQATTTAFHAALSLLSSASLDDTLLVFFSGHGMYYQDANGDEADGYDEALLFYDADRPLLDDTLALWLDDVPVGRLAVFIDSCYSGGQLDSRAAGRAAVSRVEAGEEGILEDLSRIGTHGPKDLDRLTRQLAAVSACRFNEVSWELATLRHGIFTSALLEALDGRADAAGNGNGMASVEECFGYLQPRVQALALSVGEVQIPQMLDHCVGELEIAGTP